MRYAVRCGAVRGRVVSRYELGPRLRLRLRAADCGLRIATARAGAGARQTEEGSQGFEVVRAVVLIEMMTKEDSASELLSAVDCRVQEYRRGQLA